MLYNKETSPHKMPLMLAFWQEVVLTL